MDSNTAQITLTVLGISGALGFLLPSVDKTLEESPSNSDMKGQLTRSGKVVAVTAISAGLIGSVGTRSLWPLGVAGVFMLLTFHTYVEAFNHEKEVVA